MTRLLALVLAVLLLGLGGCSRISRFTDSLATPSPDGVYVERRFHSPDGIGKFYMGREIAKVMGHQEMMWLERPDRLQQERPDRAIAALDLQPSDRVADIGAGTGYFSFRIAPQVPEGNVYAVDVQPEMVDVLNFLKEENHADNVEPVLGDARDPHLPDNALDWVLLVDAYHEFAYPREMMTAIARSLKPGGKVALVEYRRENPLIAIKGLHKMTQKQAKKEMSAVGLQWRETLDVLPKQHLMVFERPRDRAIETSAAIALPSPFPGRV